MQLRKNVAFYKSVFAGAIIDINGGTYSRRCKRIGIILMYTVYSMTGYRVYIMLASDARAFSDADIGTH
jgi:hypothetical protein